MKPEWKCVKLEPPPRETYLVFADTNKSMMFDERHIHIDTIDKHGDCLINYIHNYTHWDYLPEIPPINSAKAQAHIWSDGIPNNCTNCGNIYELADIVCQPKKARE